MKIDLKPSRELDALIAEKIMGFKVEKVAGLMGLPLWVTDGANVDWETGLIRSNLPRYSTLIQDAWLVVEKLRENGFTISLDTFPDHREWLEPPYEGASGKNWVMKKTEVHYQCELFAYNVECFGWVSVCGPCGESPSHAICLAALEALKEK